MIDRDKILLQHILDSIKFVEEFVGADLETIYNDSKTKFAVCKNIEIIGEASAKVSDNLKSKYPDVRWREIKDFRNHLVHEYFDIDYEELKVVISRKLPELNEQIITILKDIK